MSFWGVILIVLGLILFGLGVIAVVDLFSDPTPIEERFRVTKTYKDFFLAVLLLVLGFAIGSAGVNRLIPEQKVFKSASFEKLVSNPEGSVRTTYTEES